MGELFKLEVSDGFREVKFTEILELLKENFKT